MRNKVAVAIAIALTGVASGMANAIDVDDVVSVSRPNRTCRVPIVLPSAGAGTCNFDSSNGVSSNPFFWLDPNQACKLDFALPGLPELSLGGLMGELCDTIQDYGQTALDDALQSITDRLEGNERDESLTGVMEDVFGNQEEIQNTFCPVYDDAGKLVSWRCAPVDREENETGTVDEGYESEYGDPIVSGQECPEGQTATQKLDGSWYCRQNSRPVEVVTPTLPYCADLPSRFDPATGYPIECIQVKPPVQPVTPATDANTPTAPTPHSSGASGKDGWSNWDTSKKDGWQ